MLARIFFLIRPELSASLVCLSVGVLSVFIALHSLASVDLLPDYQMSPAEIAGQYRAGCIAELGLLGSVMFLPLAVIFFVIWFLSREPTAETTAMPQQRSLKSSS